MRKLLFFFPLVAVLFYCWYTKQPVDVIPPIDSPDPVKPEMQSVDKQNEIITYINQSLDALQSICHENVVINYNGIRLAGDMIYEKDSKFRCLIYSKLGMESDMGSNATDFWFWSKRMEPSALYYGKHSDLHKTKLKGELSPRWAMQVLNLHKIGPRAEIVLHKGRLYALETSGKYIYVTMIDINKKAMLAHTIYTLDGDAIAGSANVDFYQVNGVFLPKKIIITWYNDGVVVSWTFKEPQLNPTPADNAFVIPNYEPKKDLSKL
jgi:hypothetical protein